MAKRIKTWKRWELSPKIVSTCGPFRLFTNRDSNAESAYRVLVESDYRKVMAVYNAAMKWSYVYEGNKNLGFSAQLLIKACEKAQK